jgi:hypothetical protein
MDTASCVNGYVSEQHVVLDCVLCGTHAAGARTNSRSRQDELPEHWERHPHADHPFNRRAFTNDLSNDPGILRNGAVSL